MTDKKEENIKDPAASPQASVEPPAPNQAMMGAPEKSPEALALEKHLQELHENRFEKKGARAVFHLVNFGGLHQAFNNIASVVITYLLATTKYADHMKDGMAHGPVGKGLSFVLTLPGRAVNGAFKLGGADLNKELNMLPEAEKTAELAFRAAKSQRSAIETAFMTIAGFVALAPVWYLENHRVGFLNKVDNWLHPNRSPEEKKAAALKPGDEPKETLWNLTRARLIALAVVFGIDQVRDNVDSILRHKHQSAKKPGMYKNIDTELGWGLGDKIYERLSPKTRSWLARFFSGSKNTENITLRNIQDETRGDVLTITKAPQFVHDAGAEIARLGEKIRKSSHDKGLVQSLEKQISAIDNTARSSKEGFNAIERAVFAEQSRLFITKEVILTTILSVVIYACTKSARVHKLMETVGLAKKGSFEEEKAKCEAKRHPLSHRSAVPDATHTPTDKPGQFAAAVGPKKEIPGPTASFQDALAQQPASEAVVSV